MSRPRKFDYAEARRLYEAGLTTRAIGARLGVSNVTVIRALEILGVPRRPAAPPATSVRDTELRCPACGEWKPDGAFPRNASKTTVARRGRHYQCRSCQTKAKRAWRAKNPTYERDYTRKRRAAA